MVAGTFVGLSIHRDQKETPVNAEKVVMDETAVF
jgi:hypothetical protein